MQSDADLIAEALAQHSEKAFGRLVSRHQAPVRAFLTRLTGGDRAMADDVAQETFVAAYTGLHNFSGSGQFRSWLLGIAYKRFLMERRRLARHQGQMHLDDAPPIAAPEAGDAGLRIDLERAMSGLRVEERACITICYTLGMSHSEAAMTLGLPPGTVKSHVHRGRQKLKHALAHWKYEVAI